MEESKKVIKETIEIEVSDSESDGKKDANFLSVPGAIIVAGLLIAGAVIYTAGKNSLPANPDSKNSDTASAIDNVKPVSKTDYIFGNPDAPVKLIEFSDSECPFCKQFHKTMQQIVKDYNGQVAWVYRQFPLDSLHSKARKEAEAIECAGELGGNDKFWSYLDKIFEVTPSNNGLDLSLLPEIAVQIGLDRNNFENCLNSGRQAANVESQYQDAVNSGGSGTPYTIVVAKNGQKMVINGAYPYQSAKQIIDVALKIK
ncbi:MAG: thioredoxin domain-containing protein [bacterium]|nr:thioredoxin domain-containing protein [bacterium]